jgi:CelD/BcsL family acetyltransferase involved in cellulose biosynthesis
VESANPAAFDDYVRLHSASWRPRGDAGYFASAEFETFLRSVTLEMMAGGNSKLYFLTKDGRRFAAVHAFFMHGTCCFYLSGLDRHHELLNLSPGKVLLAHVIGDAIGRGNRVFDFQGGDEGYKFQLGGRLTWFAEAMFWRGGPGSWKVPLFLGLKIVKNRVREKVVERLLPKIKSSLRGGRRG